MTYRGAIKTYYKSMAQGLAPPFYPSYKGLHPFATNQLYFEDNCKR